jgi:cysteine desulfurase
MWAATGDARFKQRADYIVSELKVVQDKNGDGFAGALQGVKQALADVAKGNIRSANFDLNGLWSPWYTLHKTFAGLRDAHRYTGNTTALAIEVGFAEWAQRYLMPMSEELIQRMLATEFGGMNEVMADLYADTGDRRWLDLSYRFEHKAVLDPLKRLARRGSDVTLLDVEQAGSPRAGWLDPQKVAETIRENTLLVSVMLANNEIGVIQPIAEIAAVCRERGVPLHCDATQAVGKIPVDVRKLGVDLMSFSGHKIYGPKGIGGLFVRRSGESPVRLEALIDGGGQEGGLRSGTLNVPGVVGMANALELCLLDLAAESSRAAVLRQRLWEGLVREVPDALLNGPDWNEPPAQASVGGAPMIRLPGNLNCSFPLVNGEALMISMKTVAVSSGSACTSANPEPSHVLLALGLGEDLTRASLRFGIGRFNTVEEIDYAVGAVAENVHRLRKLSSLKS